jgi:hypothetical protein
MIWGGIAAAITAMIVLAAQVATYIPDYTTAAEVEKIRIILVGGQNENKTNILVIQLNGNSRLMDQNFLDLERNKTPGEFRSHLLRQKRDLQKEDDRLRRALKKLEN